MIRIALNEKMLAMPVARHRMMATTPVLNIQISIAYRIEPNLVVKRSLPDPLSACMATAG